MFNRLIHLKKKQAADKLTLAVLKDIYTRHDLKLFKHLINSYHEKVKNMLDDADDYNYDNYNDYLITSLLLESWYQHWKSNGFYSVAPKILEYISSIYPVHLLSEQPTQNRHDDGFFVKIERSPYPDKFGAAEPVGFPWVIPLFNTNKPYIFMNTLKSEYKLLIIKTLIDNLKSPSKFFNTSFYKVYDNVQRMSQPLLSITDLQFKSNSYDANFISTIDQIHSSPRFFAITALAIKPSDYINAAQEITLYSKEITFLDEINKLRHISSNTIVSEYEIHSFCRSTRLNSTTIVQLNMALIDIHKSKNFDLKDRILKLFKVLISEIDQLDIIEQDAYLKLSKDYTQSTTTEFTIFDRCFLIAMHNIIAISGSTNYSLPAINDEVYKLLAVIYPEDSSKLDTLKLLNISAYSALTSLVYMNTVPDMVADSTCILPEII